MKGARGLAVAAALAAGPAISPGTAAATSYTPPTTPTGNVNGDSVCSIREAATAASTDAAVDACAAGTGIDQIQLAPGTYSLAGQLTVGDTDMGESTQFNGSTAGPSVLANDPGSPDRVISVNPGAHVAMNDLTVSGGRRTDATLGGGILVGAGSSLTLWGSTVTDNEVGSAASEGDGGGIGIANGAGTVQLMNSTVSGNEASRDGGGIAVEGLASVEIFYSTITGNTADTNSGVMPGGNGGGISKSGGSLGFHGDILAGNTDSSGEAPDCKGLDLGTTNNFGSSVFGSTAGCGYVTPTNPDVIGDPLLGPLAFNGGPTQTHAIPANSPAVDLVVGCFTGIDQRKNPRPQGPRCDAGAYEFEVPVIPVTPQPPVVTPLPQPAVDTNPPAKKRKKKGGQGKGTKKRKKKRKK